MTISHAQDPANPRRVLICASNYANEPAAVRVRVDATGGVTPLWTGVAHCTEACPNGQVIEFTVPPRDVAGFVV